MKKKKKKTAAVSKNTETAEKTIDTPQKKKRLKRTATPLWQKLVIAVNILVVGAICVYYGERMLRYKAHFDEIYNSYSYSTLSRVLIEKINLLEDHDGLFENEDGSYTFRNMPENNYLRFAGDDYRILGIDADGQITAIREKPVTAAAMFEEVPFLESEMYYWLNDVEDHPHSGIFYDSFIDYAGLLTDTANHYQTVSDLSAIPQKADETDNIMVTMLSVYDYLNAGGQYSFLNNGESFWLVNQNEEGNYYYIDENGGLGVQPSKSIINGIRPVIRFNFSLTAKSGSGTADDPFVITETAVSILDDVLCGNYVRYGEHIFRVCEKGADYAILMLNSILESEGEPVMVRYGSDNIYSLKTGAGKYLNTDFLLTLPDYQQLLQLHDWSFGVYGDFQNYSYLKSYEQAVSCYVGLPNQSFMYLNDADDYFLSMAGYQNENLIYIYKQPMMYSDFVSSEHALRPVICMNASAGIVSGNGSLSDPFVISVQSQKGVGE